MKIGAARNRNSAKALHQCGKMGTILVGHGGKLKANATSRHNVANRAFRPNWTLLNEKVKLDFRAESAAVEGFEEQTGYAEIANTRKVVTSVTVPVDPDGLVRICADAGIYASGGDRGSLKKGHFLFFVLIRAGRLDAICRYRRGGYQCAVRLLMNFFYFRKFTADQNANR